MLEIGFSHELYAPHFPECEDFEGYYCKPCHRFIEAGLTSRNWTRKHYQRIAQIFSKHNYQTDKGIFELMVAMMQYFKEENPNFDEVKFCNAAFPAYNK